MQDLAKYAFANAKIRAFLSFLIKPDLLSRLLEAKDIYELIELLKNTPYFEVLENTTSGHFDLKAAELKLVKNDIAMYRKVYDALSTKREKEFVFFLLERYQLEELKVFLRLWHKKIAPNPEDLITEAICYEVDFKKIIAAQTIEEIILYLDDTPYKKPLLAAKDSFKEKDSTFYLEAALDRDYFERLIGVVNKLSSRDKKIALKILGVEIDIENINWLIRIKKYYSLGIGELLSWVIPGGERIDQNALRSFYATNGLAKVAENAPLGPYARVKNLIEENVFFIENFLYEIHLREIKRAISGFPFTIGAALGYLVLKRQETKRVISILCAKSLGLAKAEISSLVTGV